jgi:ABC-type multidrug transport system fused ATPase/permease subunit
MKLAISIGSGVLSVFVDNLTTWFGVVAVAQGRMTWGTFAFFRKLVSQLHSTLGTSMGLHLLMHKHLRDSIDMARMLHGDRTFGTTIALDAFEVLPNEDQPWQDRCRVTRQALETLGLGPDIRGMVVSFLGRNDLLPVPLHLSFEHVSFALPVHAPPVGPIGPYPWPPPPAPVVQPPYELNDLSFTLEARCITGLRGSRVALNRVLSLMVGSYAPQQGQVYVGDCPATKAFSQPLRDPVAVWTYNEPLRLSCTLYEALWLGHETVCVEPRARVSDTQTKRQAYLDEFVQRTQFPVTEEFKRVLRNEAGIQETNDLWMHVHLLRAVLFAYSLVIMDASRLTHAADPGLFWVRHYFRDLLRSHTAGYQPTVVLLYPSDAAFDAWNASCDVVHVLN